MQISSPRPEKSEDNSEGLQRVCYQIPGPSGGYTPVTRKVGITWLRWDACSCAQLSIDYRPQPKQGSLLPFVIQIVAALCGGRLHKAGALESFAGLEATHSTSAHRCRRSHGSGRITPRNHVRKFRCLDRRRTHPSRWSTSTRGRSGWIAGGRGWIGGLGARGVHA